MNIQEFSHQLGREEHPSRPSHPSQLFRALRELRDLDMERFRRSRRPDWGVWNGQEPRIQAASER